MMPLLIRIPLTLLLLALGSALSALALVVGLYFHYLPGLPAVDSLREVQLETPLRIYTADDHLIGEFAEKRRIPVTIDAIPERVQLAFIAAEDERFRTHRGVDPVGILRAAMNLFATGERSQGGSTITMQLARNFFLTRDRTYERKIREIFLALQIERELTKDQILELYLNKIYLGQRAYGIGAAAHVYFGRTLDELELHEIAILAGLPKAPSTTNPVSSPERATVRRNYVLRRMLELGYISEAEFILARAQPVLAQLHSVVTETEAHWVAEAARQAVVNLWGETAYTRGLRITTTIDSQMQESANAALRAGLLAYDRRHGYRGPEMTLESAVIDDAMARRSVLRSLAVSGRQLVPAMVIEVDAERLRVETARLGEIVLEARDLEWARPKEQALTEWLHRGDVIRIRLIEADEPRWEIAQRPAVAGAVIAQAPEDGAILALSGGFDFFENRFDRSLQAQRQPGSAFKPLIYALALEQGMNPISTVVDAPLVLTDPALGAEWRPENYTRRFQGPTSMREALAQSRNLASIRLLDRLGVGAVHAELTRFGLSLEQHPRNLSLALGTGVLTPAEINNAYAVFASGGRLNTPWLIARIEDARGNVLYMAPTRRACMEPCSSPPGQNLTLMTSANVSLQFAEPVPILAPGAAWQMSQMLRETIRSGTGRRAQELGRSDIAGKTGTTNSYRDAWFVGFNADVVATAWIGFDDNRELEARESGGRAALPIWMDFIRLAMAGRPESPIPRPEDLVEISLLPETGERTTHNDPRGRREWLMPEQIPERSAQLPRDSRQRSGTETSPIQTQPEFIF
jgi:penicillin-binding protein 1A